MKFLIPEYNQCYKLISPLIIKWRNRPMQGSTNYYTWSRSLDGWNVDARLRKGFLKHRQYPGLAWDSYHTIAQFIGEKQDLSGHYIEIEIPRDTVFTFGAFNLRSQYKGRITFKVIKKNNKTNQFGYTFNCSFSLDLSREEICGLEWDKV